MTTYNDWVEHTKNWTQEDHKRFLQKVIGNDRKEVQGSERLHLLTIFSLIDPIDQFNNQRTFTQVYEHANKTYHVTYGFEETLVEEIILNDI